MMPYDHDRLTSDSANDNDRLTSDSAIWWR